MTAVATGIRDPRTQRWLMPLLISSLALNLIVIGAAGSFLWRGHVDPLGQPLGRRVVPSVVGYAVTLPPERVKELERLTKEEWEKVRPLRRALLDARDASNRALTAEPFDRERFLALQTRLEAADQASREAAFKLQSVVAINLTPEERRGYLRWREQQHLPRNPLDVPAKQASEPQH